MKIEDLRELLKKKEVLEEINKHLWIESQKAGYSIGIERATDEWLRLYAMGWMKYYMPAKYAEIIKKQEAEKRKPSVKTGAASVAVQDKKSKKKLPNKKSK